MKVQTFLKFSVAAAVATIALKTLAWWVTGSVGLLSDALESFVNLAAAVFALMMVTIAQQPPDESHPFGHSKAEYFSSGFEGLLILGAAVGIIGGSVGRFLHPQALQAVGWGVSLSVLSSVINGVLAWWMLGASREHRSIALEADARHLMTDVWTSVGVAGGVLLVPVTGWLWLDPLLAVAVALNILRHGWGLLVRSVDGLMDRALATDEQQAISAVLRRLAGQGVRFDHVRTRRAGNRKFCQLHMHVPGEWSIADAHSRRGEVEQALIATVPGLHATIELFPFYGEPVQVD